MYLDQTKISYFEQREFQRIFNSLELKYNDPSYNVSLLCKEIGLSRPTLFRRLQKTMNISPVELVCKYRLEKAKELLLDSNYSIGEIAYMVGFNDPNYFSKCFKKEYKKLPSEFIKFFS